MQRSKLIKHMKIVKNTYIKTTVLFLIFFSCIFFGLGGGLAKAIDYLNVNTDWTFSYSENKNIIIAKKGDRVAVYQNETGNRYSQAPDYYKQGGEAFSCGSHIEITRNGGAVGGTPSGGVAPIASSTTYKLYEGDKSGCNDDQYHENNIGVKTTEDDINLATKINYGLEPVACNTKETDPKGTSYVCPNGKDGVIEGKFKKNGAKAAQKAAEKEANNSTDTNQDAENNCAQGAGTFGWILCPIADVADGIYGWFKDIVNQILFFESDKYDNNQLEASWRVFANLASALIVLFALLMIAAQIFDFEIFSAYTVKKVLPRIVIGAILIQLSWFIFTNMIQIVNALGAGLYWLLLAPFDFAGAGDGGSYVEINDILGASGADSAGWVSTITQGVAITGAILLGFWSIISLTAIGVIISLFVAIVTITLREVVLIVLLAIAPIAIALWIFPGTKKWWDTWWSAFIKLLMMYPLIMLLFAGGAIAANIIAKSGGEYSGLFAVIAYFAPMFLIGATFKFAGQAMQGLSGLTAKLGGRGQELVDKNVANPYRERRKANKDAVKEYRKNQAFQDLNEGVGGVRGLRSKWRTNTLGVGLRRGTREAYGRRDAKAQHQGLLARMEDENLENKVFDTEAADYRATWANNGYLVNGDPSQGDAPGDSRGFLVRNALSSDRGVARAAQQEIIRRGDTGGWLQVQQAMENNPNITDDQNVEYQRQRGSGDFAQSFMPKRQDWVKGQQAAYQQWDFTSSHSSSYGDMNNYLTQLRATNEQEYRTTVTRLSAQLRETINNPETRAAAIKNPDGILSARDTLSGHITQVPGQELGSIEYITDAGTIDIPETP